MISTRELSALPDIRTLNRLCRSLAMLDAIMCSKPSLRYSTFNSKWGAGEELASICTGGGDDLFLRFDKNGAIMKGFDHESSMSPYIPDTHQIWAGIYDRVPASFSSFMKEPAFTIDDVTFCIWRLNEDRKWNCGTIKFPSENDPDGSRHLLRLYDNMPESYARFADGYYERELPLSAIEALYRHEPLTEKLVRDINPKIEFKDLKNDLEEIGYPQKGA